MKNKIISAALFVISSNAVADIQVFISPPTWIVSTSTTDEIEKYLSDIKHNQSFIENDTITNEMKKAENKYRETLKQKISTWTDIKEADDVKKICKLSIATANSSIQDKSPPLIISLEGDADNQSQFCVLTSKKIQALLDKNISLKYPIKLKEEGLYSVSMIFVFNGEKQSPQT